MKKKFTALSALLTALLIALSGCGTKGSPTSEQEASSEQEVSSAQTSEPSEPSEPEEPEEPEFTAEGYEELLDEIWLVVNGHTDETAMPEGAMGVLEAASVFGDEASRKIGYTLKDVTGDKSPELLIGAVDGGEASFESILYAVYTLAEDGPFCTLNSWGRSAYYLADNGFFYNGSGGAAYSVFGTYLLSGDGLFPICTEYYFSKEKDEDFQVIGYYRNTSGYWDTEVSDEMNEVDYWERHEELSARIVSAGLTPFAEYEFTGEIPEPVVSEPAAPAEPTVAIRAAGDQLQYYPSHTGFVADTEDYRTNVLLTAENGTVKDLRVYAINFEDADEDEVFFSTEELYYQEELTVECPLLLTVSFPGTIPAYGISYTGADGETVWRSLNLSGENNSFYLNVFTPLT